MKRKLIIFDIDGTLLYSNKIDSQCFADTYLKIYKEPFPTIDWSKYPHVTDDTIFKTVIQNQFNREASFGEMDLFRNEFVDLLKEKRNSNPEEFKEVPDAKKMIERLIKEDDYSIGIATGGWGKPARLKLAHVGIPTEDLMMNFADGNPTREDIVNGVLDEAKRRKLSFEKTVYVGDAPWDVRTTRNLQMPFIGIRRTGDYDILKQLGAETVLSDYSDYRQFMTAVEEAKPPI